VLLFIDDERRRMEPYVEELTLSGYEVEFEENCDAAWRFFRERMDEIELVILDIMMPPGEVGDQQSPGAGSRTGVSLFDMIRKTAPLMPMLIFTNVSDPAVAKRFAKDNRTRFFRKAGLLSHELVAEVRSMLSAERRR